MQRRVAAARAGEAEPDDARALRGLPRGAGRARDARRGEAVTELILGLDQGTSSTRCLALDADLVVRGARRGRRGGVVPRPRVGGAGSPAS